MRKIIICLTFLLSLLQAQSDYELGKGAQVASLPLYVGGYFSLDYKNIDDENRYRIDDIAFMGYGGFDKFSYLAELEFKEFYVETHNESETIIERDRHFYIERLYFDYNLNENYSFRLGKYNSPVGFWNLLPINVLRETTSSPVSSSIIFPKFTTGASASYSSFVGGELKIDLILQNNEDIDDDYNNYHMDEHYGVGISHESDEFALKLNGGYFHRVDFHEEVMQDTIYYALLAAKYEGEKYQVLSEIGSQTFSDKFTSKYAAYVQGLYRFTEQHLGILRVEAYDDVSSDEVDEMAIIGYTYRPLYPVAIKSEYQFHSLSHKNQFLFSFSVLF